MKTHLFCFSVPVGPLPAVSGSLLFAVLWGWRLWTNRRGQSYYFDAQDLLHYEQGGDLDPENEGLRRLPRSALTGTFGQHLKNYIGVTKLLITVSAASIAFGGGQARGSEVFVAKIILAFSILYGVLFSALMQYRYEEYAQNVRSYTRGWYSVIEALGISCLLCFIAGYFIWAFKLG
jgi:hypothetical protein